VDRVEIYNRWDDMWITTDAGRQLTASRLLSYQITFHNSKDEQERASYMFPVGQEPSAYYSITYTDNNTYRTTTTVGTSRCKVVIRPRPSFINSTSDDVRVNLREVTLWSGAQQVYYGNFSLSATAGQFAAGLCGDGRFDTICISNPGATLTIEYDCPGGQTSVDRVEVYNRWGGDSPNQKGDSDRILNYQMDFLDSRGIVDRAGYSFDGTASQSYYNIPITTFTTLPLNGKLRIL
jgi:hypothetical protein